MNITRPAQSNYVAVNRASGEISLKDITDSLQAIMHNFTEDHLYQLIVCAADTDLSEISSRTKHIAHHFNKAYKDLSGVTVAIVSETNFDFNISRMIVIQAANETTTIQMFQNEEMARSWLQNERCSNIKGADQVQLDILKCKS